MSTLSVWSALCLQHSQLSAVYILQGSVLSPILFLLVMDPLLKGLEANHLGPSLDGIYIVAFAHADDIRTITSNHYTEVASELSSEILCRQCLNSQSVLLAISLTKPSQSSVCLGRPTSTYSTRICKVFGLLVVMGPVIDQIENLFLL